MLLLDIISEKINWIFRYKKQAIVYKKLYEISLQERKYFVESLMKQIKELKNENEQLKAKLKGIKNG